MTEPNNGAVLGSGEGRAPAPLPPREEPKDQFEQEGAVDTTLPDEEEDAPDVRIPQKPAQGESKHLRDVSDIMNELLRANEGDIRVTSLSINLEGAQKSLRIGFSGKEKGRMLTLKMDGTWSY